MDAIIAQAVPTTLVPGFRSVILDAQQLSTQAYLEYLRTETNLAFRRRHCTLLAPGLPSTRFVKKDELPENLGRHGRCCLAFRNEDEEMLTPVAIAMIKYLNPDLGGEPLSVADQAVSTEKVTGYAREPKNLVDIRHWEISAVAVLSEDTSLQKLGLAANCTLQLEIDIKQRLEAADSKEQTGEEQKRATPEPLAHTQDLTFWARAIVLSNAPYWQRRGYEVVRKDWYPKGFWGAYEDLQVMTLKKNGALTASN